MFSWTTRSCSRSWSFASSTCDVATCCSTGTDVTTAWRGRSSVASGILSATAACTGRPPSFSSCTTSTTKRRTRWPTTVADRSCPQSRQTRSVVGGLFPRRSPRVDLGQSPLPLSLHFPTFYSKLVSFAFPFFLLLLASSIFLLFHSFPSYQNSPTLFPCRRKRLNLPLVFCVDFMLYVFIR